MEQNNDLDADIDDIYRSYGAQDMSDVFNDDRGLRVPSDYFQQNSLNVHSDSASDAINYPQNLDTQLHNGQYNISESQLYCASDTLNQSQSLDAQLHSWQYSSSNLQLPLVSDTTNHSESSHARPTPREVFRWPDANNHYPENPQTEYEDLQIPDMKHPPSKRTRTTDAYTSGVTLGNRVRSKTMSAARSSVASRSTARPPVASKSTARSSVASKSTAHSSLALTTCSSTAYMPTTSSPPIFPSRTEDKFYECPVCNMGEGDPERKPYTRQNKVTIDEHASAGTPNSVQSSSQEAKSKNSWTTPNRFQRHILARHLNLFKRSSSSEFTCILCGCGTLTDQPCSARFPTQDAVLRHLTEIHSKPVKMRPSFHHRCPPLSILPCTRDLYEKLKSRVG